MRPIAIILPFAPLLVLVACSPGSDSASETANEKVRFSPPSLAIGEKVRTTVKTALAGGKFSGSSGETKTEGSVSIDRQRAFEKTVTKTGPGGPVACAFAVPEDNVAVVIVSTDGNSMNSATGPLVGHPLQGVRRAGKWTITLVGKAADSDQAQAILGIESFENRSWFPDRAVSLGDSWNYDPLYFRTLVESDLGAASAKGSMTLRAIQNNPDGTRQAHIDVAIKSEGADQSAGSVQRQAHIEMIGSLLVDLDTMLEREMIIEGLISSGAADETSTASAELPIRMELRRELLPRP